MNRFRTHLIAILTLLMGCPLLLNEAYALKILPPPEGTAYFGAYTDAGPAADDVSIEKIKELESQLGQSLAFVYFSNNWFKGEIHFPMKSVEVCKQAGRIPYIRLMPWSEMRVRGSDPVFKMIDFVEGRYDEALTRWALDAKKANVPLMLEFGPEVNGNWFAWNGIWNGGGTSHIYGDPTYPDGPEVYRDAYRHIIELFSKLGVRNVTWVFHIDSAPAPRVWWNHSFYYYPGDEYIDWIGVSVFGAQLPTHRWSRFSQKLNQIWNEIEEVSSDKPIVISEFAAIEDRIDPLRKSQWIEEALISLRENPKFRRVKAVSYWNSPGWLPNRAADFQLNSSPPSLESVRRELSASQFWLGQPLIQGDSQ